MYDYLRAQIGEEGIPRTGPEHRVNKAGLILIAIERLLSSRLLTHR